MLTRQSIISGEYLASFDELPDEIRWSQERIERSLAETLEQRPDTGDLWVFGYGSLLWNPLLNYDSRVPAALHGWQRSFCIRMISSRGAPKAPGRMLALEPGGITAGAAFRIPAHALNEELLLLWIREMPTGAYRPTWTRITFPNGEQTTAIAFVAEPQCLLYEPDSSVAFIAPQMATASGAFGRNVDYVLNLKAALTNSGEIDSYVEALAEALSSYEEQPA